MKKAVSKGRGRGRGRGVVAGRGRGDSVPAASRSDSPTRSFSREQSFMRSFVGAGRTPLLREDQIEAVLGFMAERASTSMSTSSSQVRSTQSGPAAEEHPSCSSTPAKVPRQSEDPKQWSSTLVLFEDSPGLESGGQSGNIQAEEEIVCSDAQLLHLSTEEEEAGGSVPRGSRPQSNDETQLPMSGSSFELENTLVEELLHEGVLDDEVLDPSFVPPEESGGSSSEEEIAPPPVQPQCDQEARTVRGNTSLPVASTSKLCRSIALGKNFKMGAPRTCGAWAFFDVVDNDLRVVRCKRCQLTLKRGKTLQNLNTTNMLRHLKTKHAAEWASYTKTTATPAAPGASSSVSVRASTSKPIAVAASHTSTKTSSCTVIETPIAITSPRLPLPSTSHSLSSSPSQGSQQQSVAQCWASKRPYPANHPRAQALTASISKLLAREMLAFRLVDTVSFHELMGLAVPQYRVPSRKYFSSKAVPALQQHVERKIKRALQNAISSKVHLTTDSWTSKHGQGRYISLTAHWVNVVEPGTEVDTAGAQILPTPRIAGLSSVHISSSSYSSSSSSTEPSCTRTVHPSTATNQLSTAAPKRQHAVLKLISLGDRSHTAEHLWTAIKGQTDHWFGPLNLQPGMVVCDNGRNLVAALSVANLTHIPCMAHVLNLVVQKFLKNYPELDELLRKVRTECARLRRSSVDAARIAALQRRFKLPENRFICDLPTRWNSTLNMLERLCEQQQAVMEYHLQQAQISRTARRTQFTCNEWAFIKDICYVLRPFEESTRMVSADDAIVSITIPLVCLLEKTLIGMRDVVVEEEDPDSEQGSAFVFRQQRRGSTPRSTQGTHGDEEEEEEEDEETEEEEVWREEQGTQSTSSHHLVRGWGDAEEAESTPYCGDGGLWPVGSLQHMSDFMLNCLISDCRIARILINPDYWVATLLDPRYRDNLQSLISPLNREQKMREYQDTLVHALMYSFPPASTEATGLHGSSVRRGGGGGTHASGSSSSAAGGMVSLSAMWQSFVRPQQRPAPSHTGPVNRSQHYRQMVTDYMASHVNVLQDGSAPFKYWVSKLDTWPELSQYALEVLACPAASVLSERVFSAAGSVLTDRRTRLTSANVDRLTFIKMNQAWISSDFASRLPDEAD